MSVSTEKARIKAILSSISGVKKVAGGTVHEFNLTPAFAVFTEDATHEMTTEDSKTTRRRYQVWGYIKPLSEGTEETGEDLVDTWLDTVIDTFDGRIGLWLTTLQNTLTGVQTALVVEDSGYVTVQLASTVYAGFQVTLEVESIKTVNRGY